MDVWGWVRGGGAAWQRAWFAGGAQAGGKEAACQGSVHNLVCSSERVCQDSMPGLLHHQLARGLSVAGVQSKPRPGGCSGEPTLPLSTHGVGAGMQHERQPASELDQQAQQAPLGRGGEGVPGGLAGRGAGHVAVADGAANGTRAPATSLQPAGAQQQLGAGSRPSGPPTSPTGPGGAGVARSSGAKRSRRRPTRGGIFTPQGRGSSGWQQQLGAASPRSVSPRQLSFAASGSLPAGAPPGGIGGSDAGRASQGEPFGGSAGEQAAKGPPREAQADEPGPATGQVSGRSQGCVVGAGAVEQAQPAGGEQQQRHAQPPPASAAAEVAAAEEALRQAKVRGWRSAAAWPCSFRCWKRWA